MAKRRIAWFVMLALGLTLIGLAGCNSPTYVAKAGDEPVPPAGGNPYFGGRFLSLLEFLVTPAGRTVDLGDGHSLVFGPNAVAEDTRFRITRIASAGANFWWTMFSPQFEIDIVSGGRAGGGNVDLVLNHTAVNQETQGAPTVYRWVRFLGQIQTLSGAARTAAELGRWGRVQWGAPDATTVSACIADYLGLTGGAAPAGAGGNVTPTGPTFAGAAPANECPTSRIPSSQLSPPSAPAGYQYVGTTVVVNNMTVMTSYDLERPSYPTDINMIHSTTTVVDGVTTEDIIVAHTFEPIPTQR